MRTLLGWHHLYDTISEMMIYVDVSVSFISFFLSQLSYVNISFNRTCRKATYSLSFHKLFSSGGYLQFAKSFFRDSSWSCILPKKGR
jgi:hypothetical protein